MSYLSPGKEQEDKRTGALRRIQQLPDSDSFLGTSDKKILYLGVWYQAERSAEVVSGLEKHLRGLPLPHSLSSTLHGCPPLPQVWTAVLDHSWSMVVRVQALQSDFPGSKLSSAT